MKVIFLDVDGVLNEEKSRSRCVGYKGIDDKKAENLAKIVKATDGKIVLISTWKEGWRKTDKAHQGMMANYLDKKLKKQGVTIFDKTRDMVDGIYFSRGEGILDFLQRYKVLKFIILDDYQYDYDACDLTERHIKTDAHAGGLTETLADKAVEMLNE